LADGFDLLNPGIIIARWLNYRVKNASMLFTLRYQKRWSGAKILFLSEQKKGIFPLF